MNTGFSRKMESGLARESAVAQNDRLILRDKLISSLVNFIKGTVHMHGPFYFLMISFSCCSSCCVILWVSCRKFQVNILIRDAMLDFSGNNGFMLTSFFRQTYVQLAFIAF